MYFFSFAWLRAFQASTDPGQLFDVLRILLCIGPIKAQRNAFSMTTKRRGRVVHSSVGWSVRPSAFAFRPSGTRSGRLLRTTPLGGEGSLAGKEAVLNFYMPCCLTVVRFSFWYDHFDMIGDYINMITAHKITIPHFAGRCNLGTEKSYQVSSCLYAIIGTFILPECTFLPRK